MSERERPAQRGFTLLEIILATVLFALLMSQYYDVFLGVVSLEEYARESRSYGSVGPAVLDLVEDDALSLFTHPRAADAFPFRGADDLMGAKPADRLNFVARRESIHQEEFGTDNWVRSPINEVGYRLADNSAAPDRLRKLYRREDYYVDTSPLQGGDYFEVYDRVVSFDVKYLGYPSEEEARTDAASLEDRRLQVFESWDSEERKGLPTAMIVTFVIEPPVLGARPEPEYEDDDEANEDRRTFVRIIHLVQAADIQPPETPESSGDATLPDSGTNAPDEGAPDAGDGGGR